MNYMATYFLIKDKQRKKKKAVKAPAGSQILYEEIEKLVGDLPCPVNGIPFSMEVDGWGELARIGERYETDAFEVVCLSDKEFDRL